MSISLTLLDGRGDRYPDGTKLELLSEGRVVSRAETVSGVAIFKEIAPGMPRLAVRVSG